MNSLPHCFDSGLSPQTPQATWPNSVCNTPEVLITFNSLIDEISQNFQWFQEFENLRIWFSSFVKGNHSHTVFLETPLHVNTVRDMSKLSWHKYLWTCLPHCLQLRTTWNLWQNIWQDYVYEMTCNINIHLTSDAMVLNDSCVVTALLDENTRSKFLFYGGNDYQANGGLVEYIPQEFVPDFLGGPCRVSIQLQSWVDLFLLLLDEEYKLLFNSFTGLVLMPKHISCSDLFLQHFLNLDTKRNQSEFELMYTYLYLIHRRWFGNSCEFQCYYPCDVIYSGSQTLLCGAVRFYRYLL